MIGALSGRALSDASARDLPSEWGGAGLAVPHARRLRPGQNVVLLPLRERTVI